MGDYDVGGGFLEGDFDGRVALLLVKRVGDQFQKLAQFGMQTGNQALAGRHLA